MEDNSVDLGRSSANDANSMINGAIISGGIYTMHVHRRPTKDGPLQLLKGAASASAFHNSSHRFDPPKCHPQTRVAILKDIMDWILGCKPEMRDKLIMWLNGPAGAGKSAIAQSIAEKCHAEGRLLASFFFGRSDPSRNRARPLIATLAYQIYCNIPSIQPRIIAAIDGDPLIFERTLFTQLITLIIDPLRELFNSGYFAHSSSQRIVIIDGLDECIDRNEQRDVLGMLFQSIQKFNSPILFLIASRPEQDILATFNLKQSLALHSRLVLDDKLNAEKDIKLFLQDEFKEIKETHPLKHLIPETWPEPEVIDKLVRKSSAQFIYPATVTKYVKSVRHRPDHRLEVIQNLRPRTDDFDMPFAELDALYRHILSTADDVSSILHVLSFSMHHPFSLHAPINELEILIGMEPGTLHLIVGNLGALMIINHTLDEVEVLHASLYDFLSDPARSKEFFIDSYSAPEASKHLKNCIRFLSNPQIKKYPDGFLHAMEFFISNRNLISSEMHLEEDFDFSLLLRLFRTLPDHWRQEHNMLSNLKKVFLAHIRDFLIKMRHIQLYLDFRDKLDAAYLGLIEPYYSELNLSNSLAVVAHIDFFPREALARSLQLIDVDFEVDDKLLSLLHDGTIINESLYQYVARFLRNPVRSKQYALSVSGSRLYTNAALGCFGFLGRLYKEGNENVEKSIPYIRSFEELELNALDSEITLSPTSTHDEIEADLIKSHTDKDPNLDMVQSPDSSDDDTSQADSATESDSDSTTSSEEEVEEEEMQRILDEEMFIAHDTAFPVTEDMREWRDHWKDPFSRDAIAMHSESYFKEKFPSVYSFLLPARYYLMVGYIIFFLPRAGWSEHLMKLCRETVLPEDPLMYPDQTASAQRAMCNYVERMKSTEEILGTLD